MLGVVPESDAGSGAGKRCWECGELHDCRMPIAADLHQDGEGVVQSGLPEQELSVRDICPVNNCCV